MLPSLKKLAKKSSLLTRLVLAASVLVRGTGANDDSQVSTVIDGENPEGGPPPTAAGDPTPKSTLSETAAEVPAAVGESMLPEAKAAAAAAVLSGATPQRSTSERGNRLSQHEEVDSIVPSPAPFRRLPSSQFAYFSQDRQPDTFGSSLALPPLSTTTRGPPPFSLRQRSGSNASLGSFPSLNPDDPVETRSQRWARLANEPLPYATKDRYSEMELNSLMYAPFSDGAGGGSAEPGAASLRMQRADLEDVSTPAGPGAAVTRQASAFALLDGLRYATEPREEELRMRRPFVAEVSGQRPCSPAPGTTTEPNASPFSTWRERNQKSFEEREEILNRFREHLEKTEDAQISQALAVQKLGQSGRRLLGDALWDRLNVAVWRQDMGEIREGGDSPFLLTTDELAQIPGSEEREMAAEVGKMILLKRGKSDESITVSSSQVGEGVDDVQHQTSQPQIEERTTGGSLFRRENHHQHHFLGTTGTSTEELHFSSNFKRLDPRTVFREVVEEIFRKEGVLTTAAPAVISTSESVARGPEVAVELRTSGVTPQPVERTETRAACTPTPESLLRPYLPQTQGAPPRPTDDQQHDLHDDRNTILFRAPQAKGVPKNGQAIVVHDSDISQQDLANANGGPDEVDGDHVVSWVKVRLSDTSESEDGRGSVLTVGERVDEDHDPTSSADGNSHSGKEEEERVVDETVMPETQLLHQHDDQDKDSEAFDPRQVAHLQDDPLLGLLDQHQGQARSRSRSTRRSPGRGQGDGPPSSTPTPSPDLFDGDVEDNSHRPYRPIMKRRRYWHQINVLGGDQAGGTSSSSGGGKNGQSAAGPVPAGGSSSADAKFPSPFSPPSSSGNASSSSQHFSSPAPISASSAASFHFTPPAIIPYPKTISAVFPDLRNMSPPPHRDHVVPMSAAGAAAAAHGEQVQDDVHYNQDADGTATAAASTTVVRARQVRGRTSDRLLAKKSAAVPVKAFPSSSRSAFLAQLHGGTTTAQERTTSPKGNGKGGEVAGASSTSTGSTTVMPQAAAGGEQAPAPVNVATAGEEVRSVPRREQQRMDEEQLSHEEAERRRRIRQKLEAQREMRRSRLQRDQVESTSVRDNWLALLDGNILVGGTGTSTGGASGPSGFGAAGVVSPARASTSVAAPSGSCTTSSAASVGNRQPAPVVKKEEQGGIQAEAGA
ncbi:unnamed protein product [Amoebophrya sp. A120]|nr:unnamed protein product [Amoebophrya sp. A120]|eukprot:GSA120T00023303001.1